MKKHTSFRPYLDNDNHIDNSAVPNLRDIGGYRTRDGRAVRRGIIYRSDALDKLAGASLQEFAALGIGAVYDLRTAAESAQEPDALPATAAYIALDVLGDAAQAAPAQLLEVFKDPAVADKYLGGGRAQGTMIATYRGFITLPSAQSAFGRLFADLARADAPVSLYHCTTGKDRTGWATAVLLSVAGVDEATVEADYLRSNDYILPAWQHVFDSFAAQGGDTAILDAILGVLPEYLAAAVEEMRTQYGDMETYLRALGLSGDQILNLRGRLVEPA